MPDTRKKNVGWQIETNPNGSTPATNAALAVLMDIRDELQLINSVLACRNFQQIPHKLDRISANTAKPKKRKKKSP